MNILDLESNAKIICLTLELIKKIITHKNLK